MTVLGKSTLFVLSALALGGAELDPLGLDSLRHLSPSLNGAGVSVGLAEAGQPGWQISPENVEKPESIFLWISAAGITNRYPNSLGTSSDHARRVGEAFFGLHQGVAPGVSRVDNIQANHVIDMIQSRAPMEAVIVNQSFMTVGENSVIDLAYDHYVDQFNTLFISGIGKEDSPTSPSTAYNGIAVAAYGGQSAVGPTANGRSKPDLTAPASLTSFSTPLVAGTAALLRQAGQNGVAGPENVEAVTDHRTLKALLLNGAVKPSGWTNGVTAPLDARHGAGRLHAFRSYHQLRGGRHDPTSTGSFAVGSEHLPSGGQGTIPARRGWNLASLASGLTQDGAHHYAFELTDLEPRTFELQATLVWSRLLNQSAINDFDLFLYRSPDMALLASSRSRVDNVEHLHVTGLEEGTYVLQVLKRGGLLNRVTNEDTYALAFDFGPALPSRVVDAFFGPEGFSARLLGEPHEDYVIESSMDLIDWRAVSTNTLPASGYVEFLDEVIPVLGRKYYRAVLVP